MPAETPKLRITTATNDALKAIVDRLPNWSVAQLGDTLLAEACRAADGKGPAMLPTLAYLRQKLGLPADGATFTERMLIEELAEMRRELAELRRERRAEHGVNEPIVLTPRRTFTRK